MLLVSAAIGFLAVLVAATVRVRRRRAARAPSLSLAAPRGAAGVNHLAARVSELSDLGFHLGAAAAGKRRLGRLLGSSSGASR